MVLDDVRQLLVVRRGQPPAEGRWTLPGGKVEAGESVTEAVAREVREETALDVDVGELLGWIEHRDDEHHYVILDFRARVIAGELSPGSDVSDARWVSRAELGGLHTTRGLGEFLDARGVEVA